jgi:formylglycine-generating enzyme required for sulfatase activity
MKMKAKFIKPQMVKIIHQKPEISLTFKMIKVPKGSFLMGSNDGRNNEKPVHKVDIDYEFEIGKYPVTIGEYMTFVKDTNSNYPEWLEEGNEYNIHTGSKDYYKKMNLEKNAPIIGVSWDNAKAYCKWLSQKSGKNYRLPTEAEWEYACRAGITTKWSFGDNEEELEKYAWYSKNSYDLGKKHPDYGTHIVGDKKPNPWGLFDMHGNVWEWCEDDWVDNYNNTPRDGSAYKSKDKNSLKVVRGGSWSGYAISSRSAFRSDWDRDYRSGGVGFRLLRTLP